jgi:ATP-dependent DNA helicase RecG
LKNIDHFRKTYVLPAIAVGYREKTLPDQLHSRLQRYRLTKLGQEWLRFQNQ